MSEAAEGSDDASLDELSFEGAPDEGPPDALPPCPQQIYVVLEAATGPAGVANLGTFSPDTGLVTPLGTPCPADNNFGSAVALAVGRDGSLYVQAGNTPVRGLYRIDPASLACDETLFQGASTISRPFVLNTVKGMAFVDGPTTNSERLYLVGSTEIVPSPQAFLAHADPPTFEWAPTGWFDEVLLDNEPTFDGIVLGVELFGGKDLSVVHSASSADGGFTLAIEGVDPNTVALTPEYAPPQLQQQQEYWPGVYPPATRWHGDYYFFPVPWVGGAVNRYRPSDGSWIQVGTVPPNSVVAAAAAACAAE
jgi:hypothetical protein